VARHPVAAAALRALTLAPGIAPLGALFGASAVAAGFSPAAAVALSAVIFAGGAQFAAVGLVASGASWLAASALVAVINSRYFLLSAATLDLARKGSATRAQRVLVALGTVDESYALQAAWAKQAAVGALGLLMISAWLWTIWVASTLAGALLGAHLPALLNAPVGASASSPSAAVAPWGLDYALPGIFVGLLGIFADTRERLLAGLAALAAAGALALVGLGTVAVLVVPPLFAFALGRWRPSAR